jgi:hypothetical protein
MRFAGAVGWAILGGLVIVACGSSSSDGGATAGSCTPGSSIACTGAGGCSGGQVCNASGTAYGDCDCGSSGGDGGPSTDSGLISDASSEAGKFSPSSLSGLALWAVSTAVQTDAGPIAWPDQSGHGQTFTIPGGGPTYVESSTIASGPGIRFVSANNDLLRAQLGNFTSDDYIVEIAFNSSASASTDELIAILGSTPGGGFNVYAGGGSARFATGAMSSYSNASTHVLGVRGSGGYATMRIDGAAAAPSVSLTPCGASTSFTLGSVSMDVAEVLLVTSPSANDVTNIESYLKSKYGL